MQANHKRGRKKGRKNELRCPRNNPSADIPNSDFALTPAKVEGVKNIRVSIEFNNVSLRN